MVCASSIWACTSGLLTFHGPLGWGGAAFAIVLSLAIASKTVSITYLPLITWLGTISYSLYLTHTLIQQLLIRWMNAHQVNYHTWDFVIFSSCICCVAAYLYYELIETRLVTFLRNVFR